MDRLDFSQGIENALNTGMTAEKKTQTRRTRQKTGPADNRRNVFSDVLEHSILEKQDLGPLSLLNHSEETEQILLDKIRSTGDNLRRRPLPDEMLEYKKAVRNFLNYVVENSYKVEESQGIKRKVVIRGEKRWDARSYHQVKIIDRKLEELAAGILLKQTDELDLKTRLEEITGLLVDLKVTGKISID